MERGREGEEEKTCYKVYALHGADHDSIPSITWFPELHHVQPKGPSAQLGATGNPK